MSETALYLAARAAVAIALPSAKDWSNDPADPRPDKLDAYVVTVTRDSAIAESMGSDLEEVDLTIQIEIFGKYAKVDDGRAGMKTKGEAVKQAIATNPAVLALLDTIHGQTLDVDIAAGETRLARATISLSVQATF